jgi:hypothetical protein
MNGTTVNRSSLLLLAVMELRRSKRTRPYCLADSLTPLNGVVKIKANEFTFNKIREVELINILNKTKPNKTPGLDRISNKLIKAAQEILL